MGSPQLRIRTDERIIITGQSGSGKTNLVKYLALMTPRWVWIDVKWRVRVPGAPVVRSLDGLKRALAAGEPRVIYYPVNPDLKDRAGRQEVSDLCNYLMSVGNIVLITDELSAMTTASMWPNGLANVVQRGRESGVGMIAATQRPANVKPDAMSEAQHFVCFRLMRPEDRERMAQFGLRAVADELNTLPLYHWIYWSPDRPDDILRFDEKAVGKVL